MEWKWYVYIIECIDKSYYTGLTWQPNSRWMQHLTKLGSRYTAKHEPKKEGKIVKRRVGKAAIVLM